MSEEADQGRPARARLAAPALALAMLALGLVIPMVALSQPGAPGKLPCNPHKPATQTNGRPPCATTTTPPPTTTTSAPGTTTTTGTATTGTATTGTGTTSATTRGGSTAPPRDSTTIVPPPPPGLVPVAGRTAVVQVLSGAVYYRAPGRHPRVKLTAAAVIPIGSHIDTRIGTVALTTAATHGIQGVAVSGGLFVVQQPRPVAHAAAARRRLITTMRLIGGNFSICRPRAHLASDGPVASIASRRPRKRRVVRHLWANESGGGWSTAGGDAVATVQGTWWLTQDTCEGTRVYVRRGVVSVRNLRTGKRVRLTAGHAYLARGPVPH